jgi:phosphoglycolate phosphatase
LTRGPYRLLIFDWDGTLRDSIGSIVGCAQEAAGEHGFATPEPVIRRSVGLGLDIAIDLWCPGADDETRRQVREAYRRLWVERWQARADLFPEAEPALAQLHRDGYWLAVATGKSRAGLDRDLGHGAGRRVQPLFLASRTADESAPKPSPAMVHELLDELGVAAGEALVIGDSAHDLEMAVNAGCAAVAVTCGALAGEELRRLGARDLLRDVGELPGWLTGA